MQHGGSSNVSSWQRWIVITTVCRSQQTQPSLSFSLQQLNLGFKRKQTKPVKPVRLQDCDGSSKKDLDTTSFWQKLLNRSTSTMSNWLRSLGVFLGVFLGAWFIVSSLPVPAVYDAPLFPELEQTEPTPQEAGPGPKIWPRSQTSISETFLFDHFFSVTLV